jgi:DNA-binding transcriptional ArsR family regulator
MLNQVVEYSSGLLDATYRALAHPVRRAVLDRLSGGAARVTDLAAPFDSSLAAISKHVQVLEGAGLVQRTIRGREHQLALDAARLEPASLWLVSYRRFWETRLDLLEDRLRADPGG